MLIFIFSLYNSSFAQNGSWFSEMVIACFIDTYLEADQL